ncbi:PREDICTED: transmembrane protein 144-like [Amphimedon queenslandica]|uniref:Transmembrane protein 144 n=1 Tax=Amphimedon queenslandica TaxID=400682 RepID=A0A1X7SKU7_AMPQE|nr:PREDICTED: transmembrane protein 144-like [Amphimedon queenslandica]|eukprot:XP_003391932.1 PREDICTED: transmembrane protein 144-like [Amphimedon queenslandica]
MTAIKATIFIFILLALLCSTAYGHKYSKPSRPTSWVCYTTGGAADMAGGNINISTTKCDSGKATTLNTVIGFGCALIAILGFGSNFIPVKKFDTGDGMFFQWVLCIGIWLVGVVVNLVRYQPPFFYPVFFGGILWTSGNALVVPIIKTIGLTMGLTIWGATNMLSGWFTGMYE